MRRFKNRKNAADISASLQQLAVISAKKFPYYRNLMHEAGITPRELRSKEALGHLRVTTKADVLTKLWKGSRPKRCPEFGSVEWSTSGTSGPLLLIHMSKAESLFRTFSYFRAVQEHARVTWPLTITQVGAGPRQSKKRAPRLQRLARVRISRISRLLPEGEQVAKLLESQPQIVTGSPSCLGVVAARMAESNAIMTVRLVVCRGEVLNEQTRSLLAKAFAGKIVDYYNAEEIGNVAYECPDDHEKMHVNTGSCILEILNDQGVSKGLGEEGRIVVTNLFNHTMPFIRYDLGDRGTLISTGGTRCSCGSTRPSILPPSGRKDDFFSFSSGLRLSPRSVESLVAPTLLRMLRAESSYARGVPGYQIVQETESKVRVFVEGALPFSEELTCKIETNFSDVGVSVTVSVVEVEELPAPNSGKTRRVISKVAADS